MQSLFIKIFVGFWILEVATVAAVLVERNRQVNASLQLRTTSDRELHYVAFAAAEAYEAGGCSHLTTLLDHVRMGKGGRPYLLADDATALCGQTVPSDVVERARRARTEPDVSFGEPTYGFVALSTHLGQTYRFAVVTDEQFSIWQRLLDQTWVPWLLFGIPISGAVTALLAHLLVRPIKELRHAAQAMASGDLTARAPARGGATSTHDEVGALLHDFNRMADQLEFLVGAQQRLLRDVSHELRSPLARVSIALELLRGNVDPRDAVHVERIEKELSNLNRLIGQLLNLSRMETQRGLSDAEPVSLDQLVHRLVADAAYEAANRGCSVRADVSCVVRVWGNAEMLSSAIENVVRNAVRYAEPGTSVSVDLTTAGDDALILVRDSGPGVTDEELKRLGTPFWRKDPARAPHTGGFGLGLAIADRAVRLHRGSLMLRNQATGGLEVALRLPLAMPASDAGLPHGVHSSVA